MEEGVTRACVLEGSGHLRDCVHGPRVPGVRLHWGGEAGAAGTPPSTSQRSLAPSLYSFFKKGNPNKLAKNEEELQNNGKTTRG